MTILDYGVNLAPCDGELYLVQRFYGKAHADHWFNALMASLAFRQERLFIFGRWHDTPRLMAWYGDNQACYRYSGVDHAPLPWTPELLTLKQDLEHALATGFNSVLANLYRDGQDSMGCHADNEPELGPTPTIASLSFGDTRNLRFRHRQHKQSFSVDLAHGDLLIMAGCLQQHWQHQLPKTRAQKSSRLNLTFRRILAAASAKVR
ncbi:MAG: alpha-ketoglutarate-dependent dioxygenase AlkB [Methylococcales bacterium]|nr:alpha-ketoglutarate-dependent dioxygenase AlkB [Methylococcales bacterium]